MAEKSTTPDLVELADAVNRRDFDAVEGFYAPDAVLRGAEIGTFEGAAAIRGLFEDMVRPFEESHGEVEEVIDLDNGVTFAVIAATGHPAGSSGEVRFRYAVVAIWTKGVIVRQFHYMDLDEAGAAAERLAEEQG